MTQDVILTSQQSGATAHRSRTLSYPTTVSKEQLFTRLPLPAESTDIFYIRVLVLEGSSTARERNTNPSPLKAHLHVVPLTKDLSFTALSYVWGEGDPKHHTISCRPQDCDLPITSEIPITANCHAALCQIRKQGGEVTLWVDSICINQDDDGEKSSQISHMQQIYSWAAVVYIWLGEGNRRSDKAMRYLKNRAFWKSRFPITWLAVMPTRPEQKKQERLKFTHRSWRDFFDRLRTAFGDGSNEVHLYEVLNRAWVRRAWTLQEIILARNPIILCGDKVLQWEDLIHAIYDPSYIRLRDLSPHPAHGEGPGNLIAGWCSIIDIWLNLPRQSPDQPVQVTHGSRAVSLAALARSLDQGNKIPRGPRALSHFCIIWCFFWGITCFALWLYGTIRFMNMVNARTAINETSKVGRWYLLVVGWLCIACVFAILVNRCLGFFCSIFCGGCPGWFLKRETSAGTEVLSGIHVALRERECTDPRDRSFAMFGILQSLGASFSAPNMQEAVGETYRLFLQSLLEWQPSFLAMIVDAGCPIDDAPSWVPNWMLPCPSKWLTWRYTIGSRMNATKAASRSDISVNNNKLVLNGRSEGQVCFITASTPTFQSFLAEILCLLLSIRQNVKRWDPYDEPESFLFAVLHGLAPPRGPTTKEVKTFDEMGNETGSETERLPRWKGPYDFEERKQDFKTFARLYALLQTCLPPPPPPTVVVVGGEGSSSSLQTTTLEEEKDIDAAAVELLLHSDQECHKGLVGINNLLLAEKRCLFVTETGFVGSGPTTMKLGDQVFLLACVPVPMILYHGQDHENERSGRDCNYFTVRGAALIHGLMHGERFGGKVLRRITLV